MKLIIVLGNHDYTPKGLTYGTHTYSILERFNIENFKLYTDISHLKLDGVDIVIYPYHDLKRVNFKGNKDLIAWVQDSVDQFELTQPSKVFIGHGTPKGTIINDDWFFDLDIIDEPILPTSLFDPFDIALFSHIHRAHHIGDKVFHIGSPERVDFSEAQDDKGFVVYDTDLGKMEWVSTNPRPMLDVKLDLLKNNEFSDPTEQILEMLNIENIEQYMIKLSVECSDQTLSQIDHIKLKKTLEKAFYYKPPKFTTPKIRTTRIKELTEQLSASEALERILTSRDDLSESERKQIMVRGKGILAVNEDV